MFSFSIKLPQPVHRDISEGEDWRRFRVLRRNYATFSRPAEKGMCVPCMHASSRVNKNESKYFSLCKAKVVRLRLN